MAMRAMATKMGEAVQSFWDVLEAAYYGRFSLHEDGASPISQLLKVGTALTIAMSASVLTSAIALPLVVPVIICWCLVAPCTGRPARRIQSFFETCAAGSLIPFVCLWCTSVALFRVVKLLARSAPKSIFRSWASVNRRIEKTFHRTYPSSEDAILPIYRPHRPIPVESTIISTNESTKRPSDLLVHCGIRRPRTFPFLDLPPELRNAVYRRTLDPYKMLV